MPLLLELEPDDGFVFRRGGDGVKSSSVLDSVGYGGPLYGAMGLAL